MKKNINIDVKGKRFCKLLIIDVYKKVCNDDSPRWHVKCICDCGRIIERRLSSLTKKKWSDKSCGCSNKSKRTHGLSSTREYQIWKDIKRRCFNSKRHGYENYGQRGITLDPRWNDFSTFIKDMGQRPSPKHTIERHDNDKGYSPENCSWELRSAQNNNKRNNRFIFFKGRRLTLAQLSAECGVNYRTLMKRLNYKWPIERAVNPEKRVNQFG